MLVIYHSSRSAFNTLPLILQTSSDFSNIVIWAEVNKLIINSSKTKEIVLRRPSQRHYILSPPSMHNEQVEKAKLLGVLLTSTLSMQSHVKYTINILKQRLRLLNQLRKQRLNVHGLTRVLMALVVTVARFQRSPVNFQLMTCTKLTLCLVKPGDGSLHRILHTQLI